MPGLLRKIAGMTASLALLSIPAGSIAASAPQAAPSAANAWTTLSVMSTGASSANIAAAEDDMRNDGGVSGIPLPVIGVLLLTLGVAIWIVTRDDKGNLGLGPFPLSPA